MGKRAIRVGDIAGNCDVFRGVYRAHWELSYVRVTLGYWFFDLLPSRENWEPVFPAAVELPWSEALGGKPDPEQPLIKPRYLVMQFEGVPSTKGHFGHRGGCSRRVEIERVLAAKEIRFWQAI